MSRSESADAGFARSEQIGALIEAGLHRARLAHKHGWTSDLTTSAHAERCRLVSTPGGDYVLIFINQQAINF